MRALQLDTPKVSAHQILATGYDVVVCSFEFIEANVRAMDQFQDRVEAWSKTCNPTVPRPKRPTAAIGSEIWAFSGYKFKIGIQDEAH